MESNIVCNVSDLKIIRSLNNKLKNSRPTPNIAITQDCSSSSIKILFLILLIFQMFFIC